MRRAHTAHYWYCYMTERDNLTPLRMPCSAAQALLGAEGELSECGDGGGLRARRKRRKWRDGGTRRFVYGFRRLSSSVGGETGVPSVLIFVGVLLVTVVSVD